MEKAFSYFTQNVVPITVIVYLVKYLECLINPFLIISVSLWKIYIMACLMMN